MAEIVAAGHRVELHCHRHRNALRLTTGMFLDDAERARATIEEASGQAIADHRPPYGIYSASRLAGMPEARLAPGSLVAVGEGLARSRDRAVNRLPATDGPPRGHRPPT